MLTKEQAAALAAPFAATEIEWRVGQAGLTGNGRPWVRALAYLTSRAVMERLDDVFGVGGWSDSIREVNLGEIVDDKGRVTPVRGTVCTLRVRVEDGTWIEHEDVAECSDIEPLKGSASGALKRVAVKFGVGRYLYYLEDGFAHVHDGGKFRHSGKDKKTGREFECRWDPPALPAWALPDPKVKRFSIYAPVSPESPRDPDGPSAAQYPEGLVVPEVVPADFAAGVVDMMAKDNALVLLRGALGAAAKKMAQIGMAPIKESSADPIDLANAVLRAKELILTVQGRKAA